MTVLYRAISITCLVLIVTGISRIVGEEWSGILATFPTNLFVILVVIHMTYSKKHVLTLIKGYPIGLLGLLIYLISVPYTYNYLGLILGTVISYGLVGIYLFVYEFFLKQKVREHI